MKNFTAADLAEDLGVEEDEARGLLKFLRAKKLVEFLGERPSEAGQRGAHCYRFIDGAADKLARMLKKATEA